MQPSQLILWMTVFDTICWPICFLLMHGLSVRQNSLLKQLHEQGQRIEQLSKTEHDLIREVHPQVSEIKQDLKEVANTVKPESDASRQ